MGQNNIIALNEWITPEQRRFSYQIYWPFSDEFNPDQTTVDVYVRLKEEPKRYVGTFITLEELSYRFDRFSKNGECANGTYLSLWDKEIVLKKITHKNIEITIEDLIKENHFIRHFEEVIE